MKKLLIFVVLFFGIIYSGTGTNYYVKLAGDNAKSGLSWTDAFSTLDFALNKAVSGDTIKVASGAYPAPTGDGYIILDGVNVYGGFTGVENSDHNVNFPPPGATVLTGNNGRVLTQISEFVNPTIWCGFTISIGDASYATNYKGDGGGAYIRNNTTLKYITFEGNTATAGGGAYNSSGGVIMNSIFSGNSASTGGGVQSTISKVINCLVKANSASQGGGIYYSGGSVTNCTMVDNVATSGGGLFVYSGNSVRNNIIWNNSSGIFLQNSNNFAYVTNCIIQDYTSGGTDNYGSNPLFVNVTDGNYKLLPCSPALDRGKNDVAGLAGVTTDIDGKARIFNSKVDIGAYEYSGDFNATRVYVNSANTTPGDGTSWSTAFTNLDDALNLTNGFCINNSVREIYIAKGKYIPSLKPGDATGSRDRAFLISKGVTIYGGFKGDDDTETPETRNLSNNITTLSAIVGNSGTQYDSLLHVLIIAKGSGIDSVIIDGVSIMDAKANLTGSININELNISQNAGGAIYNTGSGALTRLQNVIISGNSAHNGAGIYNNNGASLTLNSVTIKNNNAYGNGGGIWNSDGTTLLKITGGNISDNTATTGGAIYNANSKVSITSGSIKNNIANSGGGIYTWGSGSEVDFIGSSEAIGNTANRGNEIYIGANGILNLNDSPVIGVKTDSKGIYLSAGISPNINTLSGSVVMFEAPASASIGRIMVTKSSEISDTDLASFTYLPTGFILQKSGNNIILSKTVVEFVDFADSIRAYDGTVKSISTKVNPDSLQKYILYEYTGSGTTNYGPSLQAPVNTGTYNVRAYLNHSDYSGMDSTVILTIQARDITITADTLNKVYGTNDPTLTYKITDGSLIVGDLLVGSLSRVAGEDAGNYAINKGTINLNKGQLNYNINFVGCDFTVNKRPITVKADDLNKQEGQPDPILTYSITSGNLIAGDVFAGSLSRSPGETVNLYNIEQGTLGIQDINGVSQNYDFTFIKGIFTIVNAPLKPQKIEWLQTFSNITYGNADILLTASSLDDATSNPTNLEISYFSDNTDVVKVVANNLVIVGAGSANIKALQSGNDEYLAATPVEKQIIVDKKQFYVLVSNGQGKTYGDPDPVLTYGYSSGDLVGNDTLSGAIARNLGEDAGSYTIKQGTLSISDNYNLIFISNPFVIKKRSIDITVRSGESTYGDNPSQQGFIITGLVNGDSEGAISGLTNDLIIAPTTIVGVHTIGITGIINSTNYSLNSTTSGIWNVNPKEISVSANSGNSIYGDNPVAQSFTASGLVNGENESLLHGLSVDVTIDNTTSVGDYIINVIGNLTNTNYTLADQDRDYGTWHVNARDLTIIPDANQTKIYGTPDPIFSYQQVGLANADVLIGNLSRTDNTNNSVGTYAITQGTLTSVNNPNYNINFTENVEFKILSKSVTVTPKSGQTKVYGTDDPILEYTTVGLEASDELLGELTRADITNQNTGTYKIMQGTLDNPNYSIIFDGTVDFKITANPITVTPDVNQTKIYGNADPIFTYKITSGSLVGSDVLSGLLSRSDITNNDVGTYQIIQGTLTNAANTNYDITFTKNVNFTITTKTLTITPDANQTKIYGEVDPVFTYQQTGLESGDLLTGVLSRTDISNENAGKYQITLGTLDNTNYTIVFIGDVDFTITPKDITITPDAGKTKVYGDADPIFTYLITSGSLVGSDALSGVLSRTDVTNENVGTYQVTQGTLTNTSNPNYSITFDGTVDYTITPKALTITPDAGKTKVYGEADPTFTYLISSGSLVGSDALSGVLSRTDVTNENVGTYQVAQGTLTNSSNPNYSITFDGTVDYTITPKAITITPDANQTKAYGKVDPVFTYQVLPNLVGSDVLSGALSRTDNTNESVGTYQITQGTLTNTNNPNYDITFTKNVNFTITVKTVTITPDAGKTKIYGDVDPVFTYQQTGLEAGDLLTGALSRTDATNENVSTYKITLGTLDNPNYLIVLSSDVDFIITQKPLSITPDAGQMKIYGNTDPTFTYQITAGSLVGSDVLTGSLSRTDVTNQNTGVYKLSQGTLNNLNYNISFDNTVDFTITAKSITVTPKSNQSIIYGEADPVYAYTANVAYTDVLSGALSRTDNTNKNVGTYQITQGNITTANNPNYIITFDNTVDFNINRRPVTVTPTANQSKIYGNADPVFNYQITTGSLIGSDVLSGLLSRTDVTNENVGIYKITQGTLDNTQNSNYDITFISTIDFNINKANASLTWVKDLSWSANTSTVIYNGLDRTLKAVVSAPAIGSVNISYYNEGSSTALANMPINAGRYDIKAEFTGVNFQANPITAKLIIMPKALTITARNQNVNYGTDPVNVDLTGAYDASGFANNETEAVFTTMPKMWLDASITATTSAGRYPKTVNIDGAIAPNYAITFVKGDVIILQSTTPYLSFDPVSNKTYGDAPFKLSGHHSLGKTVTYGSDDNTILFVNPLGNAVIRKPGTVNVYIEFAGDYDVAYEKLYQTVTIDKADLTVTAKDQSKVFNSPNPTVNDDYEFGTFVNADDINLFTTKPQASISLPTNTPEGVYPSGVTVSGGSHPYYILNYMPGTLTIMQAHSGIIFQQVGSKTYGDNDFVLVANHGGGNPVIFESLDPTIISVTGNNAKILQAGTARLRAYTNAGGGYFASDTTQTVVVKKASLIVRPDDKIRKYGRLNPIFTVSFSGLKNNDVFAPTMSCIATVDSSAHDYPIIAAMAPNSNYDITFIPGTLTVLPTQLSLTLKGGSTVYTGLPHYINPAVLSGVLGKDSIDVTYTYLKLGVTTTDATDAGTYTVTATTVGNVNHTGTTSLPATYIVNKATPVIKLSSKSVIYTGFPVKIDDPIITGSTTASQLIPTINYLGINVTYNSTQAPSDQGQYEVTVTVAGDNNHNTATAKTTLTIKAKSASLSLSSGEFEYTGNPIPLTAYVDPSHLTLTYKYEGASFDGVIYSSTNAPTDAGVYTVTVTTPGDINFTGATVNAGLQINPTTPEIIVNNKSAVYSGAAIGIDTPVTVPTGLPVTIFYEGIGSTNYPSSATPPFKGGTYKATVTFAGNNNYIAQTVIANLSINPAGAPTLKLSNKRVTYDGTPQSIDPVSISPATATGLPVTYMYMNANYPSQANPPIDAGVYIVTASTPSTSNFDASSVTAVLTIGKANQVLTMDPAQFLNRKAGDSFTIVASASSNLPLIFVSGNTDIATVDATGNVTVKTPGMVIITALQAGDKNYNPIIANRVMAVMSKDVSLSGITINSNGHSIDTIFDAACATGKLAINITTEDPGATVDIGNSFKVDLDMDGSKQRIPGIIKVPFMVTSQDGLERKGYTLLIEKRFIFDDVVVQKWDNVLMLDLKKLRVDYGYVFDAYKWYHKDAFIGDDTYYSAGDLSSNKLAHNEEYRVEFKLNDTILRTCPKTITLEQYSVSAYPNPVINGELLNVKAEMNATHLQDAVVEIYNLMGIKIGQTKVTGNTTSVRMPSQSGMYILKLKTNTGIEESFKVIVE